MIETNRIVNVSLTEEELTQIIRALDTRADRKTCYGTVCDPQGLKCYELSEAFRDVRRRLTHGY